MGQATRGHSQGPQCPVLASRTATKKEEKMERKDEKKPEDGKKEKDQAELRAGPAERSRATASGEQLGGREAQSRGPRMMGGGAGQGPWAFVGPAALAHDSVGFAGLSRSLPRVSARAGGTEGIEAAVACPGPGAIPIRPVGWACWLSHQGPCPSPSEAASHRLRARSWGCGGGASGGARLIGVGH